MHYVACSLAVALKGNVHGSARRERACQFVNHHFTKVFSPLHCSMEPLPGESDAEASASEDDDKVQRSLADRYTPLPLGEDEDACGLDMGPIGGLDAEVSHNAVAWTSAGHPPQLCRAPHSNHLAFTLQITPGSVLVESGPQDGQVFRTRIPSEVACQSGTIRSMLRAGM